MPDLKMVVMTEAWLEYTPNAAGKYLRSVASRRNDIIFTSPARAYQENGNVYDVFPPAYRQMVSFSGVNANFTNVAEVPAPYTAFAAPGDYIMTTVPNDQWGTETSVYGQPANKISVFPPLAGADVEFWVPPPPANIIGAGSGSVIGRLVDCGLGLEPCANATVSNISNSCTALATCNGTYCKQC
jgi:hypothetical protein